MLLIVIALKLKGIENYKKCFKSEFNYAVELKHQGLTAEKSSAQKPNQGL